MVTHKSIYADTGDYLKVIAVSTVFLQSILGFALKPGLSARSQYALGFVYNLVKFSAPAFIFGILFTNAGSNFGLKFSAKKFYLTVLRAFFLPFYLWSALYLLLFPELQQIPPYQNWYRFIWCIVSGNCAPHLWYAVMMLQFLILMPLFNRLYLWINKNPWQRPHKFVQIVSWTIILAVVWTLFYDTFVFHGPEMKQWYLLDRVFVSFLLFGIFGTIAAIFFDTYAEVLLRWKWVIGAMAIAAFIWINRQLFSFGLPVKLSNSPYYKPSMIIYNLSIIFLISIFAISHGNQNIFLAKTIHHLASIAYLAYLPNVIWSWSLWKLFGKSLAAHHLFWATVIIFFLTWIASFVTAQLTSYLFQSKKISK